MLVLALLSWTWPHVASQFWGIAAIGFGIEAWRLSLVENQTDAEATQIETTAAVLWTLAGLFGIIPSLHPRFVSDVSAVFLGVAALHAALWIYLLHRRDLTAARSVSKVTALVTLAAVVIYEMQHFPGRSIEWSWLLAEGIVLAVVMWFWKVLSGDPAEEIQGIAAAVAGYATLLLILARVLGFIWPPLVSMSFALAGASLAVASRQGSSRGLLLKLGGLTMVVVVGRLLIIDLSAVETIWRVLLFLVIGSMFVYTSYRLQLEHGAKAT